jgi:hypothetical protein
MIIGLMAVCAMVAGLMTPQPAFAAWDSDTDNDGWPQYMEVSGWANNANPWPNWTAYEEKWLHNAYPISCNSFTGLPAWKVIWVTTPATESNNFMDTKLGQVRNVLREVTSAWPASASVVRSTASGLLDNHAPRWVTNSDNLNGTCTPKVAREIISDSTLMSGLAAIKSTLQSRGFNETNRKYLVLVQRTGWGENNADGPFAGVSEMPGYTDTETTGATSRNNATSYSYVSIDNDGPAWGFGGLYARTIVHEMSHAMGALGDDNPNRNPQNGAHAKDCFDIMCYSAGGAPPGIWGQQYLASCGRDTSVGLLTDEEQSRQNYRLDCNDDDYFGSPSQETGYLTTHWNMYDSAYLWGGNVPPAMPKPGPDVKVAR